MKWNINSLLWRSLYPSTVICFSYILGHKEPWDVYCRIYMFHKQVISILSVITRLAV